MASINVILARSPYQVIINEANQISTKVELRLWNKGGTRPTLPTYIMSENIASVTQRQTNYNISPFILEFIDKYRLQYTSTTVTEAGNNEWCIGEYKTFYEREDLDLTLISTVSFCAVNGFSTVEQGYNYYPAQEKEYLLLANPLIKVYWHTIIPYYNFIVRDLNNDFTAKWYDKSDTLLKTQIFYTGVDEFYNYAIPLVFGASTYVIISSEKENQIFKINTEQICEPKYPVQIMWFVNKLGGWNQFTFFKASYKSINVKNSDYALMQKNINYDYRRGQTKPFNINGNGSIKVNSGWVTEDYYEWVEQMMLSDTILYSNDEIPVTIKTTSMQKKTDINDKNINYTLEFDFANKLINNIV
jgi:hypothetical protein